MVFKERLKEKRTEANLTQVELAEKAGVTARTIQNYELGSRKPSNMVTIQKIADALNTTTEYLLGSSGTYVVEAHEKGGAKAAKDIEEQMCIRDRHNIDTKLPCNFKRVSGTVAFYQFLTDP